jgi:flavin-binding protein dodecin
MSDVRCAPAANALASGVLSRLPENTMSDHVYKMLELTGSSPTGIEDAVQNAIAKANETVRNIQWFSVTETRGHVADGKVAHWQVTIKLGFTLE